MTRREVARHGGHQCAAHDARRPAEQRVIATEAARGAVTRLPGAHDPLMFDQSADRHFVTRTASASTHREANSQ